MKEEMLFAAGVCALAGLLTLSAVRKYRKTFASAQQENSEELKESKNPKKPKKPEARKNDFKSLKPIDERKHFRFSYWIRFQLGLCFLAESGLLAVASVLIEQTSPRNAFYCVLATMGLVVWQIVWAFVDAVGNYVFLSRKNAMEIIHEEKNLLRKHLREKAREEELRGSASHKK